MDRDKPGVKRFVAEYSAPGSGRHSPRRVRSGNAPSIRHSQQPSLSRRLSLNDEGGLSPRGRLKASRLTVAALRDRRQRRTDGLVVLIVKGGQRPDGQGFELLQAFAASRLSSLLRSSGSLLRRAGLLGA